MIIGAAALGAIITVLAGSEPGLVLGIFLVAGTAAAALAVRPHAVFLLIPVPALAYVIAATAAGVIHDQAGDTTSTALAISAAQWIAGGFVAMTAGTVLAIAVTIARRPWGRRGLRGPGGPRGPGSRPPARGADRLRGPGSRPPAREADRPRRPQATRNPPARYGPERDADYLAATARRPAGPRRPRD
jgi:hypothetical protein